MEALIRILILEVHEIGTCGLHIMFYLLEEQYLKQPESVLLLIVAHRDCRLSSHCACVIPVLLEILSKSHILIGDCVLYLELVYPSRILRRIRATYLSHMGQ